MTRDSERTVVLRTTEAAQYVGLAPSTLSKMRVRGDGPAFCKVGPRVVVYRVPDLDHWLESRRRRSTSDCEGANLDSWRKDNREVT